MSRVADSIRTTTHFIRLLAREVAFSRMRHCSTCVSHGRRGHDDLTSHPHRSSVYHWQSPLSSQPDRWQQRIKVALVAGLNPTFLTRADDSHAAPVSRFRSTFSSLKNFRGCQEPRVRFFALHRFKPHAPPLVRAPSIHLSFNLAPYSQSVDLTR